VSILAHGPMCVSQSGDSKLLKAFDEKSTKLHDEMTKFAQPPSTLKEYSRWMSVFQASHYDQQLEIPGLLLLYFLPA